MKKTERMPPIVCLMWKDAMSTSSWSEPDEIGLCTCVTVGFLIKEDKEKYVVASTLTEDNQCGDSIAIPKQWAIQKQILKK